MKKLIFTLMVSIALAPLAKAQNARFGFTGGGTLGYISLKTENGKNSTSTLFGFSAGAVADLPLSSKFSFQPSLEFLQKGGSQSGEGATSDIRLNNLELPLNFIYRAPGKDGHFVVGLGPSLSYSLSGKESDTYNGETSSGKIHFGSGDDELKPLEFCGNVLVGFEWKSGFFLQANYSMGLTSLFNDSQNPGSSEYWHNNFAGLRFGYFLGRK
jgi:hypothetical protein